MKYLEKNLVEIYRNLLNNEFRIKQIGQNVHPDYQLSALNLSRYIMLRSLDLRKVHDHLSELGISSLRSCEGYVWSNLTSSLKLVKLLNGKEWKPDSNVNFIGYRKSKKLLKKHASALLGSNKNGLSTQIMVTLPSEAADNPDFILELLEEGMSVARINMSHDDAGVWLKMVENIKSACEALGKKCRIYMDLSGPKIRSGKVEMTDPKKKNKIVDYIRLKKGEHLILNANADQCSPLLKGENGELIKYACVGVTLPSILDDVKIGDRILFDDGKIECKVLKKRKNEVEVVIQRSTEKGLKFKGGKGINLPDTKLNLPSLTEDDIRNIPFVAEHADLVGYSFVRNTDDVRELYKILDAYDRPDLGVVMKIENQDAFENLPLILLEAMQRPNIGVMIARGDLAVELGAERIAEVQDQIMWFCEAAHVPVIWATQVLESLAKTGLASRAEVTDAAKSARVECVMLNKGPHILDAIRTLKRILKRMDAHTSKKKNLMRALNVAKINVDRIGVRPLDKIPITNDRLEVK